jgi:uncharacterized protein (TIGR02147 family)
MLRGERAISAEMRERLGGRLGLGPQELANFAAADEATSTPSAPPFHQLSQDTFTVISDWYHYAILELIHVRDFEPIPAWVARRLGITVVEARAAVERLERVGLLEITATGQWRTCTGHNSNASADLRAAANRKLQRQVLEMAIHALDDVSVDRRDQSSMTMSIDSSRLPQAMEKITQFRRELCSFLESGRKRDEVYQLSVSLYPLTKLGTEKKGKKEEV